MPRPIGPDDWRPSKPPAEGRSHNQTGMVAAVLVGWFWRHKLLGAALTLLAASIMVVVIAFTVLQWTDSTPPPAQTGPTPTLIPDNGGPTSVPASH